MNKIRLLFLIVVTLVCVGGLLVFNSFKSPLDPQLEKMSTFIITQVSGNGKIVSSPNPIETGQFPSVPTVNIKQRKYEKDIYFRADNHTGMEFYSGCTRFIVFPNTYFQFRAQTQSVLLYEGSLEWLQIIKGKTTSISILDPKNVVDLSRSGRVTINGNNIELINYSGDLTMTYGDEKIKMGQHQLFSRGERKPPKLQEILPPPSFINPLDKKITLQSPTDSEVKFSWKSVPGAGQYRFNVFSSPLLENSIYERIVTNDRLFLDLLLFEEREIYWRVVPISNENDQMPGTPSPVGYVKLLNIPLEKKDVNKKPELTYSISRNGNTLIIKGFTQPNNEVYINDELVPRNLDGSFLKTITYNSIGKKIIQFKVRSPMGVETSEEREMTIFEE